MRVAVAQVEFKTVTTQVLGEEPPETPEERCARVLTWLESFREQGPFDLLVLPELWLPGAWDYTAWPASAESPEHGRLIGSISSLAARWGTVVHAGSVIEPVPVSAPTAYYNTSVVFDELGRSLTTYRKIHRFGHGTGESAVLSAGRDAEILDLKVSDGEISLGVATCYDLRFPELFREYVDMGADSFVLSSSWPLARIEHWRVLLQARAIENQALVIACNTAGQDSGVQLGGHSAVIAADGTILAEAGTNEEMLIVDVPVSDIAEWRAAFPALRDRCIGVSAASEALREPASDSHP